MRPHSALGCSLGPGGDTALRTTPKPNCLTLWAPDGILNSLVAYGAPAWKNPSDKHEKTGRKWVSRHLFVNLRASLLAGIVCTCLWVYHSENVGVLSLIPASVVFALERPKAIGQFREVLS